MSTHLREPASSTPLCPGQQWGDGSGATQARPDSSLPELIEEYARIEGLLRAEEARVFGGAKPPMNPDLVRLQACERALLAMMRRAELANG